MKAMKWILGAVAAAAAIVAPLHSANAWGGRPDGGGGYAESHRVHYRGGDYPGDRGDYRGYHGPHHRYGRHGYYGQRGYYRGHRHYYGGPGYYGRPWYGYRGPVVVVPTPPPPPFPW